MSPNAYELLALCMRYVFAVIMLLIVFRAWRVTLVDGQRAARLRRISPETGIVGELLVVDGHDRAKYGMHYPLTLEGTIGSTRGNDIRLRSSSVRRRHAIFQMTENGLFVRNHARSRLYDGFGRPRKELTLHDGDFLTIGSVRLMLILSDGDSVPKNIHMPHKYEERPIRVQPGISRDNSDLFEVSGENEGVPAGIHRLARKPMKNDEDDVFFDYDEYDDC